MADLKLNNPKIVGKLKLPAEVANKVLQVNASGELESSTVSSTALSNISSLSSAAVSVDGVQTLTNKTLTSPVINTPTGITKSDVGLSNVDNTSDLNKPISTATQSALDLKADLVGGKLATSQIPALAITETFVVVSEVAMLALTAQMGDVAIRSDLSKTYILQGADPTVLSNWVELQTPASPVQSVNGQTGTVVLTKSDVGLGNVDNTSDATKNSAIATLTNKTIDAASNTISNLADSNISASAAIAQSKIANLVSDLALKAPLASPTFTGTVSGITAAMVGLGNVDNTSDATKNSAVAALTNKTIDASSNTITNLVVSNLATGVLDTDLSTVSAADDTLPSAKATKAYVDSKIGASGVTGDIAHTSFSAANNQSIAADVTGLSFSNASVRSFKVQLSVALSATSSLYEAFELMGVLTASGYTMAVSSVGDDSGVVFSITAGGQVQYTSANSAGFTSNTMKFRATVTNV